ncbi:hypothetical protein [Chitinimonas sp. BJYL2]|uniref:hypothetical protein n=1 Tax=Chitinimonas sp. BJYL2 TaxID=2976696 RepID=UPI0022B3A6C5|nr:hypothetical protein [Chitinimonas sp. BJYL2]
MSRTAMLTLIALTLTPPALAAATSDTAPASAADAVSYRSVFETYQPWMAEMPAQRWRAHNEQVGKLGGHAGHLPPKASAPKAQEGTAHHHHHHGKMMSAPAQPAGDKP